MNMKSRLRVTQRHCNGTIRHSTYEFPLAYHSNYSTILYRLRDIARYLSTPAGDDHVKMLRRCLTLIKLE